MMNPHMIGCESTIPGGIQQDPGTASSTREVRYQPAFVPIFARVTAMRTDETARCWTIHRQVHGQMDSGSADVRLPRYIEGVGG